MPYKDCMYCYKSVSKSNMSKHLPKCPSKPLKLSTDDQPGPEDKPKEVNQNPKMKQFEKKTSALIECVKSNQKLQLFLQSLPPDNQDLPEDATRDFIYCTQLMALGNEILDNMQLARNYLSNKRLVQLLKIVKPSSGTTAREAAGIALLLSICNLETFECFTQFLLALNDPTREETINILKTNIPTHFQNRGSVNWVIQKFPFLTARQIQLINYLENKPEHYENTFKLLEASRLVNLPSDLEQFITMTKYLFFKLENLWIKSLDNSPQQLSISWHEYVQLLQSFMNEPGSELSMRLTHEPVCCWARIILENDNFKYQTAEMFGNHTVEEWTTMICSNYTTTLSTKASKKWLDVFQTNRVFFQHSFAVSKITPTNLQQAIALCAITAASSKQLRFIWQFPTGMGKSYIIAFLGMIAQKVAEFETVHIVIPNNLLLARDKKKFAHFFQMLSIEPIYHNDLQFEALPKSLIVIDEIDVLLSENPLKFYNQLEALVHATMIGFTATLFQEIEMEHDILTKMSFQFFTYWPDKMNRPGCASIEEFIDSAALIDLIKKTITTQPVLVFCDQEKKIEMESALLNPRQIDEEHDFEALRSLHLKQNGSSTYQLLLACNPRTMRGSDFRSPAIGIALIIAKKFQSKADLQQGLGRVGRYKDPCKRFAVGKNEIDLVDAAAAQSLHDVMYKLISQLIPLKKNNEAVKHQLKSVAKKENQENKENHRVNPTKQLLLSYIPQSHQGKAIELAMRQANLQNGPISTQSV